LLVDLNDRRITLNQLAWSHILHVKDDPGVIDDQSYKQGFLSSIAWVTHSSRELRNAQLLVNLPGAAESPLQPRQWLTF
jgi:hypothetical protein